MLLRRNPRGAERGVAGCRHNAMHAAGRGAAAGFQAKLPKTGQFEIQRGAGDPACPKQGRKEAQQPPRRGACTGCPCSPLASSGIWPRLPKPHISTPSPSYCHNCFCSPSAFALLETHPLPLLPLNVSYIQPRKFSGVPRG